MKRRQWFCTVMLLPALTMVACMAQSDKPTGELPTVRVGIGMSIDELKAGSTLPMAVQTPANPEGDLQAVQIFQPYNLVYVDAAGELRLDNIGGPYAFTNITLREGHVSAMLVTVQNGRTNLHQAMEQARAMHHWFMGHGYGADSSRDFLIKARNSTHAIEPVTDFESAEKAFLDPQIRLAEMGVFGLRKGEETRLAVNLTNGRRMRDKYNDKPADESKAAEEKTYALDLQIVESPKPYIPVKRK